MQVMDGAYIGEVALYGFNFSPHGFYPCAGQVIAISEYAALFSLLGTVYGGDGRRSFGLPDLRGRVAISQGSFPGSMYEWRMGEQTSAETKSLSQHELPPHSHTANFTATNNPVSIQASTDVATQDGPSAGAYLAKNDGGRNPGVFIYRPDAGSGTVPLGGVSGGSAGGTVTIGLAGNGAAFSILQPLLTMNYCIAYNGIYPPRS
jgi:microcystin-dependent protein